VISAFLAATAASYYHCSGTRSRAISCFVRISFVTPTISTTLLVSIIITSVVRLPPAARRG
jgi:hypothetical protein